jgi:hypothetical protein
MNAIFIPKEETIGRYYPSKSQITRGYFVSGCVKEVSKKIKDGKNKE